MRQYLIECLPMTLFNGRNRDGLGFGLDFLSAWLAVMYTYFSAYFVVIVTLP